MTKAEIQAGICGFAVTVEAQMVDGRCRLSICSECKSMQKMAQDLGTVDPAQEISFRGAQSQTYSAAAHHCRHAACPVPSAIVKVVEVEAGLSLPKDVHISINKTPG